MRNSILLTLLFGGMLGPELAALEPKKATRIQVEDGLSQSTVYSIHKAIDGRIWFATGEGVSIWDGQQFEYIFRDLKSEESLPSNYTTDLLGDGKGNIFVATLGGGVSLFNQHGDFLRHLHTEIGGEEVFEVRDLEKSFDETIFAATDDGVVAIHGPRKGEEILRGEAVRRVQETSDGSLWVSTYSNGVFRITSDGGSETHFTRSAGNLDSLAVNMIFEDSRGNLWLGSEDQGLFQLNKSIDQFEPSLDLSANDIPVIHETPDGRLWFGSWNHGLYAHDPITKMTNNFAPIQGNIDSISSKTIISLAQDDFGGLWVGTYDAGVNRIRVVADSFKSYFPDRDGLIGPPSGTVWSLEEDANERLWIGTKNGLSIRESDGSFYAVDSGFDREDARAMLARDNHMLVALRGKGIVKFNLQDLSGRLILNASGDPLLQKRLIRLLIDDENGGFWAGTHDGLFHISADNIITEHFSTSSESAKKLPHDRVRLLHLLDEILWIGTSGGLSRLELSSKTLSHFSGLEWLPGDDVRAIHELETGEFLIATGSGLSKINFETGETRFFTRSDGLPSETLYSLLPDNEGKLWITSNNGLVRFDPKTETIETFSSRDGLQGNEFNFNAYASMSDGQIAVGGVNGFSLLNPGLIAVDEIAPSLSIRYEDATGAITPKKGTSVLNGKTVAVDATVYHFDEPRSNKLMWRLEPIDRTWKTSQGVKHSFERENLPPGEYVLSIKAVAPRGTESDIQTLNFVVPQNPFISLPALLGYAILIGILGYLTAQFRTRQVAIANRKLEEAVRTKTRELVSANAALEKSSVLQAEFYARAAHEIRTPLSLIQAPIKKLLRNNGLGTDVQKTLATVDRSTERLKLLTDGMIAASERREHLQEGRALVSLNAHVSPTIKLYENLASAHEAKLECEIVAGYAVVLKPEPLDTILHNLLSNAIRHSQPGAKISFKVDVVDEQLTLSMSGQGELPADAIATLLSYANSEVDEPASRGLELVGASVAEVDGTVALNEASDTIEIRIPLGTIAYEPPSATKGFLKSDRKLDRPNILIIEDDPELLEFLMGEIAPLGAVCGVANLHDASAALDTSEIELILSDIMLPDGDGIEFCDRLKSDLSTSHIPVIFLSALNDAPHHRAAMEAAGDDFIGKPFDPDTLVSKVGNRLAAHKAMRKHLALKLNVEKDSTELRERPKLSAPDQEFHDRFEAFLADSAHDPDTNLAVAAKACRVSERSLQRKLKALYGKNFQQSLTDRRMQIATELLDAGHPVKQVASACGYNNHSSFSRRFRLQFGRAPREAGQ